jgi:Sec-independent protein translocase protein TatA
MDFVIKFLDVAAWPIVAIIGILVLGPGGVLLAFTDRLGRSIGDFTRAIPELKETASTLRSDTETLVAKAQDITTRFSEEYRGLEERIDRLSKRISDQLTEVREALDEMDKSKIVEVQEEINRVVDGALPDEEAVLIPNGSDPSADEMMDTLKQEWDILAETLRERLGNPEYFDRRQIGSMAWRLSHGRRTNKISKDDAELIAELHSQFKRFTRLSSSKDEWLTGDVFSSFLSGVRKALGALTA